MKTFAATPTIKIGTFILLLLMLIGTGVMVFVANVLNSAIIELGNAFDNDLTLSPITIIAWALCSLPIIFFGLLSIWMLAYFIAVFKARLIFDDRSMTFEFSPRLPSFRNRGLKPFSIQYDQIQRINGFGETGALEMFDMQGTIYRLAPIMFGKNYGENVLTELGNHLPSELIGSISDHSKVQKDRIKKQRIAGIPLLIWLIAYLVTLLFDPRMSSRPWINAWQTEFKPGLFEPIWGYAPDPQDKFWLIGWHTDHYRIYSFPDKSNREWELPDSILGDNYPTVASQDASGNPIVWDGRSIYHFTNGNWNALPFQDNLEFIDWESNGVVIGRYGWAVETKNNRFLKIDGLTGKWLTIPLPESAMQLKISPASLRLAVNGDILVLMRNDAINRVYLFRNEKWQTQEYSVILPDNGMIRDFFLDNSGYLWVLINSSNSTIVEKISPSGELQLTSLTWTSGLENWFGYRRIFIDTNERIWVTGSYPPFIIVFQPIWNDNAVELVKYTTGNSNYQESGSTDPTMTPDGKIWGFDQRITSMDTNQKDLPAPLPDWCGNIDWNLVRIALLPFQLIATIYMVVQSKKLQKQLQQRN
ncbi:MAG: hypothetical protein ACOYZ6_00605 [Chloroflexota bacterium]